MTTTGDAIWGYYAKSKGESVGYSAGMIARWPAYNREILTEPLYNAEYVEDLETRAAALAVQLKERSDQVTAYQRLVHELGDILGKPRGSSTELLEAARELRARAWE